MAPKDFFQNKNPQFWFEIQFLRHFFIEKNLSQDFFFVEKKSRDSVTENISIEKIRSTFYKKNLEPQFLRNFLSIARISIEMIPPIKNQKIFFY